MTLNMSQGDQEQFENAIRISRLVFELTEAVKAVSLKIGSPNLRKASETEYLPGLKKYAGSVRRSINNRYRTG